MNMMKLAYAIIGIIILVLLAYMAISYTRPSISKPLPVLASYPVMAQLTDPPQVPNGTQSLNMSYASVRFHIIGSNFSEWLNAGTSGKIDLLSLVNISKTLGSVTVPANSAVDELAFNITGLTIEINGTTYPVAVPNSTILVHLTTKVNTSSSILADLSPTIITIITNSSVPVFVMVPSVRSIIVSGVSSSAKTTGYAYVNTTLRERFERVVPNISITGASIGSAGNITTITLSVKNNANTSATLRNVLIFGNESMHMYFNLSRGFLPAQIRQPTSLSNALTSNIIPIFVTNSSTSNNKFILRFGNEIEFNKSTGEIRFNESGIKDMAAGMSAIMAVHHGQLNATEIQAMLRNITGNSSFTIPGLAQMNASAIGKFINGTLISDRMESEHMHFRVFNFLIASNGTLVLPFDAASAMNEYYRGGYTISPGGTATLTFSGRMTLGNSGIVMDFEPSNVYRIVITGEEGLYASSNVTAS
ncbi:MAG: hypothetical protein QW091_01560 [Candidatus Micrarchaeaceae archaeon]